MKKHYLMIMLLIACITGIKAQNYPNIVNYNLNGIPTYGVKIKTNLPFSSYSQMPTITIQGYNFDQTAVINLTLVYYIYDYGSGASFIHYKVSSFGTYTPDVYLSAESGKVVIYIDDHTSNFQRFTISAFAQGLSETSSWFSGWTVVDEVRSGANSVLVPYSNKFAGDVSMPGNGIWNSGGRLGVGISSPNEELDVNGNAHISGTLNADGYLTTSGLRVFDDPGSDATQGLTPISLVGRGLHGDSYAWSLFTAPIAGGFGVKPNAFEIWEYPPVSMNPACCIPRFTIDKSNSYAMPVNIDKYGGVALGGFSDAGGNMLAVNGSVGIGTAYTPTGYKLAVNGNVIAEQVNVILRTDWPDYVFKRNYKLPPLSNLKSYIDKNHHLPEVPSEKEVTEKGLNLGEMNKILVKKVEELTLYLIEKDKVEKEQATKIQQQQDLTKKLMERLDLLEKKVIKSN